MERLPDVGIEVVVRDQSGGAHRARVLAVAGTQIAFELIFGSIGDPANGAGSDRLLVSWPDSFGLICLPTRVLQRPGRREGPWLVQIVGDSWREQRRRFLRTAATGLVRLRRADRDLGDEVLAQLIDLSEAGLRCAISERHSELREASAPVVVCLDLGTDAKSEEFELPGKVLYGRPTARADAQIEVVILFNRPVIEVERLRQHLQRTNGNEPAAVIDLDERRARRDR